MKFKNTVYKATIIFEKKSQKIAEEKKKAGRFILATNVLENLSPSDILTAYKGQQSCERGFRFLKDPERNPRHSWTVLYLSYLWIAENYLFRDCP